MPLLRSFKSWGEGKKVLIVSPFSVSLEHQYRRRNNLIVEYEFPDFELLTYTSPVTYNLPGDSRETLGVTTDNWHQECRRMAGDIAALDFDVALLSCASYSMYLGDYVSQCMGKKAIYLGGILNVYFNVYGGRYDTPFFNAITRPETQIEAFENGAYAVRQAGWGRENEALRAYFGSKPS